MLLHTIAVPVDGTAFSTSAVPVAAAIGRLAGAGVSLVAVAAEQAEVASLTARVEEAAKGLPERMLAEEDIVVDADPVVTLLAVADRPGHVLCVASHDHLPGPAAIRNSVGSLLIERARHPLLVVGREVDVANLGADVVVAIDGRESPETLLATASRWAGWLGARLRVVTVYEPVLPDLRDPDHFSRAHGPSSDPAGYLQRVTRGLDDGGRRQLELVAIPDPVSVADGLAQHLDARPALVVVAGGEGAGHDQHHLFPGVVRQLLRRVHLPVLVVPGPPRVSRWEQGAEAAGVYVG